MEMTFIIHFGKLFVHCASGFFMVVPVIKEQVGDILNEDGGLDLSKLHRVAGFLRIPKQHWVQGC